MSNGVTAMWDDYTEYQELCKYFGVKEKTNGFVGPLPYNMSGEHWTYLKKLYRKEREAYSV